MIENNAYFNLISNFNSNTELEFVSRSNNLDIWDDTLKHLEYVPFLYTNNSIRYQESYRCASFDEYYDLSSIIRFKGKDIAVFPFSLAKKNNKYKIFSHGYFYEEEPPPLNKPLFISSVSQKLKKSLICEIINIINKIAKFLNIHQYRTVDNFENIFEISNWHLISMGKGAEVKLIHELYVDLDLNINEIKSKFRKSYKSLIKEDKFDLKTHLMDKNDMSIWSQFKKMHFKCAGRVTRSDKSWDMHLDDINNNAGILIYIQDKSNNFLGGGFFNFTKNEAIYSVAAYDRDYFHLPLGHIIQYRAIIEFKKKYIKWYLLGHLPFLGDERTPSEKYLKIGHFKKGFATNIFPKYVYKHKTS